MNAKFKLRRLRRKNLISASLVMDIEASFDETKGYCRAASVSERSEANDRVLFEILLYIYIYIIIYIYI